jgi:hypothetical protein
MTFERVVMLRSGAIVAFLAQFAQALSFSAAVLAGNHPNIAGHLVVWVW